MKAVTHSQSRSKKRTSQIKKKKETADDTRFEERKERAMD